MRMVSIGILALATATGAVSTGPRESPPLPDTTVAISTFQFRPGSLVIPPGTRVTWTNGDEIEHTVTAGVPDAPAGGFSGDLATQRATFAHRFTRAGTFAYFCERHPFMRGEIRVTSTGER